MADKTLELSLLGILKMPDSYQIQLRLFVQQDGRIESIPLEGSRPVQINYTELLIQANDADAYGMLLTDALFDEAAVRDFWARHYDPVGGEPLQVRLRLDVRDQRLNNLAWELLRDPITAQPLAQIPNTRFARYLDPIALTAPPVATLDRMRALVVVANPVDLHEYRLPDVDVDGEIYRALVALGHVRPIVLGDHEMSNSPRATLAAIRQAIPNEPYILYLVCHSGLKDGQAHLWLEKEDGRTDQVSPQTFANLLTLVGRRPVLAVIASCHSAGGPGELLALGPLLARSGVPAVLGFQSRVLMRTVRNFLNELFRRIDQGDPIEQAAQLARLGLSDSWWQPVLWVSTTTGAIVRPRPDQPALPGPPTDHPAGVRWSWESLLRFSLANLALLLVLAPVLALLAFFISGRSLQRLDPAVLFAWLSWLGSTVMALWLFRGYRMGVRALLEQLAKAMFTSDQVIQLFMRAQFIAPATYQLLHDLVDKEIEVILEQVLKVVAGGINTPEKAAAFLLFRDGLQPTFEVFRSVNHSQDLADLVAQLSVEDSLAGRAIRSGLCEVLYDSEAELPANTWQHTPSTSRFRGRAAARVRPTGIASSRVIGVLCLDVMHPIALSSVDQSLMLSFADKIANVYERYY